MLKDFPRFKVDEKSKEYEELLHYTNLDVLGIILRDKTLKLNSIKNLNDRLEQKRKGIERFTPNFYVSSFCHYPHEIVPFWFMYGGNRNKEKILLRFKNFANTFENTFFDDWAITSEGKILYFDVRNLFHDGGSGISINPKKDPTIESRQTVSKVRMFDIIYKPASDEVFLNSYRKSSEISFDDGKSFISLPMQDLRTVGKYKTVNWEYEAETRVQCMMNILDNCFFDFLLLRFKDEAFRDLNIVANPWASDEFIQEIEEKVKTSDLPKKIKDTIRVVRSELDGQIIEME